MCTWVQVPVETIKEYQIPEMGVMGDCEPIAQCGCWTPNLGTRQEQYALFSSEHHSSLRRTILELRVCQ